MDWVANVFGVKEGNEREVVVGEDTLQSEVEGEKSCSVM